ncbi:hypothetical protein Slin15195_G096760 [Septoria linicola]|uniref:Uncharacterized protein n=1 Tax=Septoria linicola TaxID=215465 RepID=A0A9Q9EN88_9PEZI|nr:hypothetical protein Slin14017_G059850 [Septoria linicola]USW56357.1 hypothetical protein Slin15195_G096760 [Septoria linicola]
MPGDNVTRFYLYKLDQAGEAFDRGDSALAGDPCKTPVTAFDCPRLIQASARQLRSNCTESYWLARDFLAEAIRIGEALNQNDDLVRESTAHSRLMFKDLDDHCNAYWAGRQEAPPRDAIAEAALDHDTQAQSRLESVDESTGNDEQDDDIILEFVESDEEQTASFASGLEKKPKGQADLLSELPIRNHRREASAVPSKETRFEPHDDIDPRKKS